MNPNTLTMKVVNKKGKYKDIDIYTDIEHYVKRIEACESVFARNLDHNNYGEQMYTYAKKSTMPRGAKIRHTVLSFQGPKGTLENARELANHAIDFYADNYQIYAAVHNDTENVHIHMVMNMTGLNAKHYSGKKKDYYAFQNHLRSFCHKNKIKLQVVRDD